MLLKEKLHVVTKDMIVMLNVIINISNDNEFKKAVFSCVNNDLNWLVVIINFLLCNEYVCVCNVLVNFYLFCCYNQCVNRYKPMTQI